MTILGPHEFTGNFYQAFNENYYQLYKTHAENTGGNI